MVVRRALISSLVVIIILGAGIKKGESDGGSRSAHGQRVGTGLPNSGLVKFIKESKLANFPTSTIGQAFDAYPYLTKKEWKVEPLKNRYITVDFLGWFEPAALKDNDKGRVKARGIDVTFIINPDGSFYVYLVSMVETKSDGKVHRYKADSEGILGDIYANRKINF